MNEKMVEKLWAHSAMTGDPLFGAAADEIEWLSKTITDFVRAVPNDHHFREDGSAVLPIDRLKASMMKPCECESAYCCGYRQLWLAEKGLK